MPNLAMEKLSHIEPRDWLEETERQQGFLRQFGDRLPQALWQEHAALRERLGAARA